MKKILACGFLAALALVLLAMPARAVKPDAIQRAVDRGVEALKNMQQADGTWPHPKIGATALAGLTLVECGVKDDDPAVQKAARAVRQASIDLTHTYSISLAILFLDRLGDPNDVPLIESLMVRLMAGQDAESGGWTYDCPGVNTAEARRLQDKLKGRRELSGKSELPKEGTAKKNFKDLSPEIQKQIEGMQKNAPGRPGGMPGGIGSAPFKLPQPGDAPPGGGAAPGGKALPGGGGPPGGFPPGGDQPGLVPAPGAVAGKLPTDNSNTQFAALALWVGRRHGFPVEDAVMRLDQRFRGSQLPDGGWKYNTMRLPPGTPYASGHDVSTPTMTCAGVLGLAIADGATLEYLKEKKPDQPLPEITKDKQLMLGIEVLGSVVGSPRGLQDPQRMGAGGPMMGNRVAGRTYYFLWSLERCCVALDLDTIGKKKWYDWGAEILLENQTEAGAWIGEYADCGADTCFALLFLKRANLARDLTAHLRGRLKDPGERVLRGSIGGAGLKSKRMASGIEYKDAKPIEKPAEPKLPDTEEGKLAATVVKAAGSKQLELIEKMQTEKGPVNTAALALAIPLLDGEMHKKAREALAERLTRMKEETLSDYLRDENAEIRRAAALAVAMKESKPLIPNLIPLLRDPEMSVVRAAHAALKDLTGQDFGPSGTASREERDQVAVKWLQWWGQQRKKTIKE